MCPYYMSIGMTYEQYWDSSPYLLKAYREADKLRYKRKNEELWLQGAYIYEAFSIVMANAFGKKGSKKVNYPDKPYDLFAKTEIETQIECEKEREKAIESLSFFKQKMDAKQKEGISNVGNS